MFKNKYRIVRDNYLGYEVQVKKWFWPFWVQACDSPRISNTWSSIESAKRFIEVHKCRAQD